MLRPVLSTLLACLFLAANSFAQSLPQSLDLDADGRLDLVLVDASGTPRLLRNAGEGRFEELADRGGLPASAGGLHWHDVDGDGDLDVLALGAPQSGAGPRLFENAGPLVFVEVERAFALVELDARGEPQWLDFDGDARVDLMWSAPDSVQFLRQVRRGVFEVSSVLAVSGASADLVAPPPNGGAVVGSSTGTGPLAASSAPSMICAGTLVDTSTGNCIEAASTPTLGELYPLSPNFNLDGAGRVGMGTTSPLERLDVAGRVRAQLGLRFGDGTLQTTAGTRDWTQLLNVPAGFADGIDNDTLYSAGAGLSSSGTTFSLADNGVASAQLANDAASLAKVTGGGASMGAGSLMVNTVIPAGRVRIRHSSSTSSPHLMLTQDGASTFSRIAMDNPLSAQTWVMAGSLTATPAGDRLNFFHSTAGDVLSVGGNNRVGVNTANPLTALHVGGSLHLQGTAQDITVPPGEPMQLGHFDGSSFTPRLTLNSSGSAVFTGDVQAAVVNRRLHLTSADFIGVSNVLVQATDAGPLVNGYVTNVTTLAKAPIHLPHGSTITGLRAKVRDAFESPDLRVRILRMSFEDPLAQPIIVADCATSGANASPQTIASNSINLGVIDNDNYAYFVQADWIALEGLFAFLFQVRIEYTTPASLR